MRVTVQASPAVAEALRGDAPATPESLAVDQLARIVGGDLRALHETDDPALRTYFTLDIADDAGSARFIEQLRRVPGITAAYVKPPEALP